jgi:hypothetical protein
MNILHGMQTLFPTQRISFWRKEIQLFLFFLPLIVFTFSINLILYIYHLLLPKKMCKKRLKRQVKSYGIVGV